MRRLTRHPAFSSAVAGVAVEAVRTPPGVLSLRFVVDDSAGALVLPARAAAARTDGLWRRTCFEALLRAPAGEVYYELNLSPSTQWAAYRFDDYRAGMAAADIAGAPAIEATRTGAGFELSAKLDLSRFTDLPPAGPWRLALSAVIEDAGGVSYWALAHPSGEPDFHHSAGFVAELV